MTKGGSILFAEKGSNVLTINIQGACTLDTAIHPTAHCYAVCVG